MLALGGDACAQGNEECMLVFGAEGGQVLYCYINDKRPYAHGPPRPRHRQPPRQHLDLPLLQGHSFTLGYDYNACDQLKSTDYPGTPAIDLVPDALGRPTRLGSHATGIAWAPNGKPTGLTWGNGVQASWSWNLRGLRSHTTYGNAG